MGGDLTTFGRQAAAAYHWLHDLVTKPRIDPLGDWSGDNTAGPNDNPHGSGFITTGLLAIDSDFSRVTTSLWADGAMEVDIYYWWRDGTTAGNYQSRYLTTVVLDAVTVATWNPDNGSPANLDLSAEVTELRKTRVIVLDIPFATPGRAASGEWRAHGLCYTALQAVPDTGTLHVRQAPWLNP